MNLSNLLLPLCAVIILLTGVDSGLIKINSEAIVTSDSSDTTVTSDSSDTTVTSGSSDTTVTSDSSDTTVTSDSSDTTVTSDSSDTTSKPPPILSNQTQYTDLCVTVTKNEKCLTGACHLYPPEVLGGHVNKTLEYILDYNNTMGINDIFWSLYLNATAYFKKENNESYNGILIDFDDKLAKIGETLKKEHGLESVSINDIYEAYYYSGMEEVVKAVIDAKDDELFANFSDFNDKLNCKYGSNGFCGKTEQIFKLEYTIEWRNLTLNEALLKMIDNSWDFFKKSNPTYYTDRDELKMFIQDLNTFGTNSSVEKFQEIINKNRLFNLTLLALDDKIEVKPLQKTTVATTTGPPKTTLPKKIIPPAVSDEIAYGIPAGIVGLGIVTAMILVLAQIYTKPVINIIKTPEVHEMKNVQLKRI